jgi:ATP-dependent helicase HepA
MVISAIESFLSKDHGNSAFFRLEKAGEQLLMVETVSILECIAPDYLHADRFLPARPIRQIIDQKGRNRTDDFPVERIRGDGRPGPSAFLREKSKALKGAVPPLLEVAAQQAEDIADEFRREAIERMSEQYNGEIDRLVRLREMGHPVREEEIEMARKEKELLEKYLGDTPLKNDSVRLILAMT